ncbi:MAG: guanylate kinase [Cyclobacteriaceae bacterium]|jgi:guanylate kinase
MSGKAFIFSAPSGSGKTTIVRHLLESNDLLSFSISATNRSPRPNEINGKDYYFFSEDQFKQLIAEDGLVEFEEVYPGRYYGTLRSEVEKIWGQGKHIVFDVDVVGGIKLKKQLGKNALAVFVRVPSIAQLQSRLTSRGTENNDELSKRLGKAEHELRFEPDFDVTLVNDKLEETLAQAQHLVQDFLAK